jgi:type IV pilus assembly protein PilA
MQRKHSRLKRRSRVKEQGFTLMELLIVMSLILVLMALAIPGYRGIMRRANELSAKQSLRAIATAEVQYESDFPTNGFTCTLSSLGGDKQSGPATSTSAQLLSADLASGQKSGYTFAITNCTKVNVNNQDMYTSYEITAVPQSEGNTGDNGFCDDMDGVIKRDPQGGTNCTVSVQ